MSDLQQDTIFGKKVISTISYSEQEIIRDILFLHCDSKSIDCDPTYSIGNFYKRGVQPPPYKFDIDPQLEGVKEASADNLPLSSGSVNVIMFDPPFIAGTTTDDNRESGIMRDRFGSFKSIPELWAFYERCLNEFHRVLTNGGTVIFKCQDSINGGKQYLSHVFIINRAIAIGYYPKDLFVLLAKHRVLDVSIEDQQHARKFHSYFLVLKKEKPKVVH